MLLSFHMGVYGTHPRDKQAAMSLYRVQVRHALTKQLMFESHMVPELKITNEAIQVFQSLRSGDPVNAGTNVLRSEDGLEHFDLATGIVGMRMYYDSRFSAADTYILFPDEERRDQICILFARVGADVHALPIIDSSMRTTYRRRLALAFGWQTPDNLEVVATNLNKTRAIALERGPTSGDETLFREAPASANTGLLASVQSVNTYLEALGFETPCDRIFQLRVAADKLFVLRGGHYYVATNGVIKEHQARPIIGIHYNSMSTVPSTSRCVLVDNRDARMAQYGDAASCPPHMDKFEVQAGGTTSSAEMQLKYLLHNGGAPIITGAANRLTDPVLVHVRGPHPGGLLTTCAVDGWARWSRTALRAFTVLQQRCAEVVRSFELEANGVNFSSIDFILKPSKEEHVHLLAGAVRACVIFGKTWEDGGRSFRDRAIVKRADQVMERTIITLVRALTAR